MFRFYRPFETWMSGRIDGYLLSLSIALRTPTDGEFLIYDGSN